MIEYIEIRNFKSIRCVDVALSPVTVLIGRSGVGKSNFLRAIRFLRNYLLSGDNAAAAEGGWGRIFPFGVKAALSYRIRFVIPGYEKRFHYEVAWKPSPSQEHGLPAAERLRLGDDLIFGWSEKEWEAWPDARPKPPSRAALHLSSFPTVSEAVLAFTFLTSGIGWHDFPADVFRAKAATSLFGDVKANYTGLHDTADNYLDVLRDLTQNLQSQHARRQILARARQINPSVSSLEIDSILDPKKVVVGHRVGAQLIPLDLSQESDGFRRYYAHLLALYQSPPKQVLMFEEPENGIYPGALRNLAEEFRIAAEGGRGQALLTTQSPDLLDGFDPETIRVVNVDNEQSTLIGPLDPDQIQAIKDHLLEPGELMTVDPARSAVISS
jgi:predicted ATPase